MDDDFGFLSPELQQLTAGKQQQQSMGQHSSQRYSPHHFAAQHTARHTPPPPGYAHHSHVTPLSPSLGLSSFPSFPLPSPPSTAAVSSSDFPLPEDLDGGLLSSDYHQMLLSDAELGMAPLGSGSLTTPPLAPFDATFLSSEGGGGGGGSGGGSRLSSQPQRHSHPQNVQPLSYSHHMQPSTPNAVKSEHPTSPPTFSQPPHQPAYQHSHPHSSPLAHYSLPAAPAAPVSSSSSGSRSSGSPHGRSIDEYLAMHAQLQQQQQQQQQQQAMIAAAAAGSFRPTGQSSQSPVSAAASLLSAFHTSSPPASAASFPSSSRSPRSSNHSSLAVSRTTSPTAPSGSGSASSSTHQYEPTAFSFPPPPATLGAAAGQLKHLSPQQHHGSLAFTGHYPAQSSQPPPSAISSLVSAPPSSTSPSPPRGHLRSRSGQLAASELSSVHPPNLSVSPHLPTHSMAANHGHSHSPSAATRSTYPHLFSAAGVAASASGGGSASPSLSDTSSSLSSSTAALQLQQAQLQRQLHAAQMHQLQQEYPAPTSASQLFTQPLSAQYAQLNSLPSARPVIVNAGTVKLEPATGLSAHPPPPTLMAAHPSYPLGNASIATAAAAASLPSSLLNSALASNMLGAFNIGTFAAPPAKAVKVANTSVKSGLKRATLTSSASTPSLTSLPGQQGKAAKGRGGRGGKGAADRAGVPDAHRKKNRLARKAELARASRKRKKAYLGELEDEVRKLTVQIAQVEAVRFGQAMDAAAAPSQTPHRRNDSASPPSTSLSPPAARSSNRPNSATSGTSPNGTVAESPHELHLDRLHIAEQLETAPQPGQPATTTLSASPPLQSSASADSASAASIVSSLPRVQSDSNLSLSSAVSSVDASMDSHVALTAASSFACTVGELVGRSQYYLSAIRSGFCPGDQEKFALFGFQQAAEIHAQQQQAAEQSSGVGAEPGVSEDETAMADDSSTSNSDSSARAAPEATSALEPAVLTAGTSALAEARAQLSAASASSSASPTTQPSPLSSLSLSSSGGSAVSGGPLASSVSALHTFWQTLLRSELGVDDSQLDQLKRLRDTMAPFTAQLRALESRMGDLQPAVLSHQHRMLEARRRVRAAMSDEQFDRLQRWLDKNEWVDHMLTSQVPALALAAQQQQLHNSGSQHGAQQHGAGSTGMPRTASGTRLSAAAANSASRGGGGGSDDDDDSDEDDLDSDDEGDGDERPRNSLHSRSMSIAEEKEENEA